MSTRPQGPAASAPTPRSASWAVPAAPASTGEAASRSASPRITPASALHRSGAAAVSSTQPPPAPHRPPVTASIVPTKLGTASAMRPATATPASGTGVTVPSPWRTPGPTAPPHCPAGTTSTTSATSCATRPSACSTTLSARGTARRASTTSTAQTTSGTTTATRAATARSAAGTGWTALLTGRRTWPRAPW